MASQNAYKLRRQVENIILQHGGIIFGGHVRDVVLRDIHATEFYKLVGNADKQNMYNDATCHPEWDGRLAVSNDIDCYMVSHAVEAFLESLADEHITVYKVFEHTDARNYLPNLDVPSGVLSHIRYNVTNISRETVRYVKSIVNESISTSARTLLTHHIDSFVSSLQEESIKAQPVVLDMFIAGCYNFHRMCPPFGPVDFECNGLIMEKGGIMLAPSLYPQLSVMARQKMMQRIIKDISQRKAVYVDDSFLPPWRIQKMLAKGWTVDMKYVVSHIEPAADVCIFCHDNIDTKHYKLPCCSAVYHKECLVNVLSSDFRSCCIQCKQATFAHLDMPILKHG